MKLNWKWILVIVLILALIAAPLVWRAFIPFGGYNMMRGYGYGMPMMNYGYNMMPFGMWFMWFMWLIPLGTLVLITLGIAWVAKQLTMKPQ